MTYRIEVSPTARDDLIAVRDWISVQAQSHDIADAYVERIEARFETLANFPNRGSPRPDLGPTLRSIPFERGRTIIYRVDGDIVRILRVLDGARDLGGVLG